MFADDTDPKNAPLCLEFSQQLTQLCESNLFSGCFDSIQIETSEQRRTLLHFAKSFASAPISGFPVGAYALGASGRIYIGCNMEFSAVPLSCSLHAEQSVILNAWMHGEKEITELHISELPCGHCRQFLAELSERATLKIQIGRQVTDLATLLPLSFGTQRNLGQGLLDHPPHRLEPVRPSKNDLHVRAINAAMFSYTPYTDNPVGCAIECTGGKQFAGRSAESVAFNPSVPAIVCALNQKNLSSHRNESIQSCILAKLATGINSQSGLTRLLLKGISAAEVEIVILENHSVAHS